MANPTAKINVNTTIEKNQLFQYPTNLTLEGEQHFVTMNIWEYTKPEINKFEKKNFLRSIVLPMPPKLLYGDAHEYEEFSSAVLGQAYSTKDATSVGEGVKSITATALGLLKNMGITESINLVAAQSGASVNPRNLNVYKTPKYREFTLEYSLIAKNEQESEQIKLIIDFLRYHSYPEATNNTEAYFNAPDIFEIRYRTTVDQDGYQFYVDNVYLPTPLPSALIAINADYYPFGEPSLFKGTHAPVEVKLTLVFKELELDNKQKLFDRYRMGVNSVA